VLARVTADTRFVTLMLANHETGAIQPVRHVAKTLPKTIPLHCDAAQAVGKIPVDFADLGVAALSASAHKFHGPKGIGLLLLKKGAPFQPTIFGGHQQRGVRPGTEAVPLAVGLAVALRHAVAEMESNRKKWLELREAFLANLGEAYVLNGSPDGLPTTLNLSFPGCRAEVLLMALDLAGVACSTGSACSSGSLLPSPVLAAMGVQPEVLESAMRFSFHAGRTTEEMADAAKRVTECIRRTRH
jgi:cysteine desulfurase